MANIKQRGNTYTFRVSCGYDTNGKQIRQNMTYIPKATTAAAIDKEVKRAAILFEESCKQGQKVSSSIKFQKYADQWLEEIAPLKLKTKTLDCYRTYAKLAYKAIGHMKLDKITARHIQQFINDLAIGERQDKYKKGKLAASTIKNYVSFISGIFEHAKRMQVLTFNPCSVVTLPKDTLTEQEIYSVEEIEKIIELLYQEDEDRLHYVLYFMLAMFTGLRRGELLGLEWKDFDGNIMSVNRTSNYTTEKGVYTDTPKTRGSYRPMALTPEIMDLLNRYKAHQAANIEKLGSLWEDHDRLFTKWNGLPMFTNTPSLYFGRLCKKHGIRFLNIHSFRHFTASMLISKGLNAKTVCDYLGHSTPNTTYNIYCHAFNKQAANTAAMEIITGGFNIPTKQAEAV